MHSNSNPPKIIGCHVAHRQDGRGTPVDKAVTAGAGVEICGYLNLNVRIVFVVSRAAAAPTLLHRENLVRPEHLIEFRSTVIFLSPRIKYVSIHRESERDLICKTQVTFNLFEFTILRCPCRLRWRMDVTNISPQITILRRGRTCALCRVQSFIRRLSERT